MRQKLSLDSTTGEVVIELDEPSKPIGAHDAGWSSPVAREAHNLEVTGSNPVPATFCKSCQNLELSYLPAVGSAALKVRAKGVVTTPA